MTAIKVIAIDRVSISQGVVDVRNAVAGGGAKTWKRIDFGLASDPTNKIDDLVKQLANLVGSPAISKLEIVAEGRPYAIDSLDTHFVHIAAQTFGANLRQHVPGISNTSKIYLSGCNTGLADGSGAGALDHDVSQLVADSSHAIVYGARGYISGAHALQNEEVFKESSGAGSALPGGTNAHGSKCWRKCVSAGVASEAAMATAEALTITPMFATARLSPLQIRIVREDISGGALLDAPSFRMSPELVISLPSASDTPRTIHVIANATLLRDAASYEIWRNSQGHGLFGVAVRGRV